MQVTSQVAAVEALTRIAEPQSVEAIVPLLKDHNSRVRGAVVEALSKLGGARFVGSLNSVLQDPDWEVRRAAAEALGRIKDVSSVDALSVATRVKRPLSGATAKQVSLQTRAPLASMASNRPTASAWPRTSREVEIHSGTETRRPSSSCATASSSSMEA